MRFTFITARWFYRPLDREKKETEISWARLDSSTSAALEYSMLSNKYTIFPNNKKVVTLLNDAWEEYRAVRRREGGTHLNQLSYSVDFEEGIIFPSDTLYSAEKRIPRPEFKIFKVKREQYVDAPKERALVDQQCGVPSTFRFPGPFDFRRHDGEDPYALRELAMMTVSATIREKESWERKYKDPIIREKWREESKAILQAPRMFEYVINELAYYESLKDGPIEVSSVDGIWQADELISTELREALLKEAAKLENVPDIEKDWHPGSDMQVLNLVHPSMFCFVTGVTLQIDEPCRSPFKYIGSGKVRPTEEPPVYKEQEYDRYWKYNKQKRQMHTFSYKYHWLPSDFLVHKNGKVSILSYINNLHPENVEMYNIIAKIFEKFVPMFEKVLVDLVNARPRRFLLSSSYNTSDKDGNILYPPVPEFTAPPPPRQTVNLRGRQLQVIVKLANIILKPSNPEYNGGSWHVEGMQNEHIVASGIYYYDSHNISDILHFRTCVTEPPYDQGDDEGVKAIFGLEDQGNLVQNLGSLITKSGRCIAFPNLYQHWVAPFSLQDQTKVGYRKILVFFLVDPGFYIASTLKVPPQQPEWRYRWLKQFHPFNTLPDFIFKRIIDEAAIMTKADAENHRAELMKERKFILSEFSEMLFERPFSLCEH